MSDTSTTVTVERPRSQAALVTVVIAQMLQVLSLLPWLMASGMAFMVFDSPGSDNNPGTWAFAIMIWSYPLWLIGGGVATWILYRSGRSVAAALLAVALTMPTLTFLGLVLVNL